MAARTSTLPNSSHLKTHSGLAVERRAAYGGDPVERTPVSPQALFSGDHCRSSPVPFDKLVKAARGRHTMAVEEGAMRFLSIYKTRETGVPPTPQHMATMQRLIEEGMKAGWLIATEGCLPSALGARVRATDGNVLVTDGPFVESKEVIGGFAILEGRRHPAGEGVPRGRRRWRM